MAADSQKLNTMPLESYTVNVLSAFPKDGLTGRRKILTPVREITRDNVLDVLNRALAIHAQNAAEIQYLYDVYRGRQDILDKVKHVREKINNKVVVNRANEIVTFKTAFLLNEPVQYVVHGGDDGVSKSVNALNEMMRLENKAAKDKEIIDWMHICGVAERLVLPDSMLTSEDRKGAPFKIYTLDPREAFVIYNAGIGQKPLAGVILQKDEDEQWFATVYTSNQEYYTIKGDQVVPAEYITQLGGVPLIEYVHDETRMGAFEAVLPILNAINTLESNAVDSVEDFVNGFDVFQNCEIDDGTYGELSIGGKAIKIKTFMQGAEAKVYRISSEINQTGVQTRIDDLTDQFLMICGMPNRNGGLSTSDTGAAVQLRDGWSDAYSRAKNTATLFVRSEREFDEIVLTICNKSSKEADNINLDISDFEPKFPFGNLQNVQSVVQSFTELLNSDKVHPHEAYIVASSLFKDTESAYRNGMEWYEQNRAKQEESLNNAVNAARLAALNNNANDDSEQTDNENGNEASA